MYISIPVAMSQIAGLKANSVDPDQTPRSACLHYLLRPVCPKT